MLLLLKTTSKFHNEEFFDKNEIKIQPLLFHSLSFLYPPFFLIQTSPCKKCLELRYQWITLKNTPSLKEPPLVLDGTNWDEGPRTALAVGRRPKTSYCVQQGPRV